MARLKLKIQIMCGDEIAIGPGKADLLDAIDRTGSISAAARDIGMSYRRSWMLVDTMNRCFAPPLVETRAGGGKGAGAHLTDAGHKALAAYRALSQRIGEHAAGTHLDALQSAIREAPAPAGD